MHNYLNLRFVVVEVDMVGGGVHLLGDTFAWKSTAERGVGTQRYFDFSTGRSSVQVGWFAQGL